MTHKRLLKTSIGMLHNDYRRASFDFGGYMTTIDTSFVLQWGLFRKIAIEAFSSSWRSFSKLCWRRAFRLLHT